MSKEDKNGTGFLESATVFSKTFDESKWNLSMPYSKNKDEEIIKPGNSPSSTIGDALEKLTTRTI